jgi:peptidoglycan/LPS O-acetylase OafA/YrhL
LTAAGASDGYRPEIDGLRAVAVVAVILYHAQLGIVSGGYLGVDIFFVISGFLITGIVEAELAAGRFSILRFYERRIRRIIPALMVTMLLCIPLAWRLMLPDDLENFGQSLVATTAFANNVLLMLTSGYFALATDFKPLVHTWTLGIEEQYYLIVPLLLAGVFRWGGRRMTIIVITAITAFSFAIALYAARYAPVAGFYLLPSRAWELGAGSLVALQAKSAGRRGLLAALGLAIIIFSLFLAGEQFAALVWPITIPVAGTCLLLAFGRTGTVTARALAWRPAVIVGLMSYSLYLYHQPVFAFARIASLDQPSRAMMALLIAPVFLLAWASWRFVERPFRDRGRTSTRTVVGFWLATSAAVLAIGGAMAATSGFKARWPELAEQDAGFGAAQNQAFNTSAFAYRDVALPDVSDKTRVLVLGNSFARDFINMGRASGNFGHHIVSYDDKVCPLRFTPAGRRNLRNADFVVFGSSNARCLTRWLPNASRDTNARIIVLGTKNFGWNNNAVMLLDPAVRYGYRTRVLADAIADNDFKRRAVPPALFVDLLGMLMDGERRVAVFTPDHKFISQDREHLTRAGAAYVGGIVFRDPRLRALALGVSSSPESRR